MNTHYATEIWSARGKIGYFSRNLYVCHFLKHEKRSQKIGEKYEDTILIWKRYVLQTRSQKLEKWEHITRRNLVSKRRNRTLFWKSLCLLFFLNMKNYRKKSAKNMRTQLDYQSSRWWNFQVKTGRNGDTLPDRNLGILPLNIGSPWILVKKLSYVFCLNS